MNCSGSQDQFKDKHRGSVLPVTLNYINSLFKPQKKNID